MVDLSFFLSNGLAWVVTVKRSQEGAGIDGRPMKNAISVRDMVIFDLQLADAIDLFLELGKVFDGHVLITVDLIRQGLGLLGRLLGHFVIAGQLGHSVKIIAKLESKLATVADQPGPGE